MVVVDITFGAMHKIQWFAHFCRNAGNLAIYALLSQCRKCWNLHAMGAIIFGKLYIIFYNFYIWKRKLGVKSNKCNATMPPSFLYTDIARGVHDKYQDACSPKLVTLKLKMFLHGYIRHIRDFCYSARSNSSWGQTKGCSQIWPC